MPLIDGFPRFVDEHNRFRAQLPFVITGGGDGDAAVAKPGRKIAAGGGHPPLCVEEKASLDDLVGLALKFLVVGMLCDAHNFPLFVIT